MNAIPYFKYIIKDIWKRNSHFYYSRSNNRSNSTNYFIFFIKMYSFLLIKIFYYTRDNIMFSPLYLIFNISNSICVKVVFLTRYRSVIYIVRFVYTKSSLCNNLWPPYKKRYNKIVKFSAKQPSWLVHLKNLHHLTFTHT